MLNQNQTEVMLKDVEQLIELMHTRLSDYATQRTFTKRTKSIEHSMLGCLRNCLFELEDTRDELIGDLAILKGN